MPATSYAGPRAMPPCTIAQQKRSGSTFARGFCGIKRQAIGGEPPSSAQHIARD